MNVNTEENRNKLKEKDLKITPQRLAILEAVHKLGGHPTAERISDYIRKKYPGIATGTVYKVLETLVEKELINKVKTDKDVMRYDGVLEKHHHLYGLSTERIEDYKDEELDNLLAEYFKRKMIPGFEISDIKLHINGKFNKEK